MKPGAIKTKLAKMITEAGHPTDPDQLYAATGYWRVRPGFGNCRWEGWTEKGDHVMSFYTMTECVKKGFVVKVEGGGWATRREVWVDVIQPPRVLSVDEARAKGHPYNVFDMDEEDMAELDKFLADEAVRYVYGEPT